MTKRFSRKVGGRSRRHRRSVSGKILPPIDVRSASSFGEMAKRIMKGPLTIVLVYADWCGHCHHFMPHFDAAANSSGRSIQAVKINESILSQANQYLNKNVNKNAKPINVEGYPSVLLVKKDGSILSEVEAQKDTDVMTKVMSQAGPLAENAGIASPSDNRTRMASNLGMEEQGAANTETVRNFDVNENLMIGTTSMATPDEMVAPKNTSVRNDTNTSMGVSPSEIKAITSLHSVEGNLGSIASPPRMEEDVEEMEKVTPRPIVGGGSLYQAMAQSAYTLAPTALLFAAAVGLRRGKHQGTKKRGKKSPKTKRRSKK